MVHVTNSQTPVVLRAASFKDFFSLAWSLSWQALNHNITPACFSSSSIIDSLIRSKSLLSVECLSVRGLRKVSQARWSPLNNSGSNLDKYASRERLHKVIRPNDDGEKQKAWGVLRGDRGNE